MKLKIYLCRGQNSTIMKKILYFMLSLLGFTACGEAGLGSLGSDDSTNQGNGGVDDIPCMYGTPTTEFVVKGKVSDSAGVPIKGIVVSSKDVSSFIDCSGLSAVTADDGTFTTNKMREFGVMGTLIFTDTDGEANGGDFATLEVNIAKLPKSQTKEGDGAWNMGEYEVTADVSLNKK